MVETRKLVPILAADVVGYSTFSSLRRIATHGGGMAR